MRITAEHVIHFLDTLAARMKEQRAYLTELDSPIGDADHGTNLDRGFSAVVVKLPELAGKDIGTILKMTGMTLVSNVGGSSGPLYGTAFLRAGMLFSDRYELADDDLQTALEAALAGIMMRGKAQRGEKTMIDTLAPAIDALKSARAAGADLVTAVREATIAAEQGMQATIPMLATKGRASYVGERSIGHQDPGATSAYLIIVVLREGLEQIASKAS